MDREVVINCEVMKMPELGGMQCVVNRMCNTIATEGKL